MLSTSVIHGDCLKVMPRLQAGSVDLIVTDPPYLVSYRSRDGRELPNDVNGWWVEPAYEEMYRVLKSDAFCISFYGWTRAEEFILAWKRAGFRPVAHLVWAKDYPSQSRVVRYRHESAFVLAKGNPQPRVILDDVLPWTYTGNRLHPTQKPLEAIAPLIEAYSLPGDLVLDPFCGSGTTLVAARKLGRASIGIELASRYADAARRRLGQYEDRR